MRVLVTRRFAGAFGFITDGWINALNDSGFEARRWDNNRHTWEQFDPDLYIGSSAGMQNIPLSRRAKVAIHVNPYGPTVINNISEDQRFINQVVNIKPDVVFGYGFECDRIYWSYWYEKLGIPWVPMPTAGDSVAYTTTDRERVHDIIYLGMYTPYKGPSIDTWLAPILNSGLVCAVYGNGWTKYSRGFLPDEQVLDFYNSGKIAPCISEFHTTQYMIDVPERCWKAPLCGCLAIHDNVHGLNNNYNSIITTTSPNIMLDEVMHYLRFDKLWVKKVKEQRAEVLGRHTYHHRMAGLLTGLGFTNEAKVLLDRANQIYRNRVDT